MIDVYTCTQYFLDTYYRTHFNCEYLLVANYEAFSFAINRFANMCTTIRYYGTGLTIAIIGFAIWPDLTSMQLLNHTIKTCPTVPQENCASSLRFIQLTVRAGGGCGHSIDLP